MGSPIQFDFIELIVHVRKQYSLVQTTTLSIIIFYRLHGLSRKVDWGPVCRTTHFVSGILVIISHLRRHFLHLWISFKLRSTMWSIARPGYQWIRTSIFMHGTWKMRAVLIFRKECINRESLTMLNFTKSNKSLSVA